MARVYLSPPDVGPLERELLLDAFDSNWIAPLGPHVDAFEEAFRQQVGVAGAAALSSGTAALHLALILLGVGPGDEVIVSDLTFVATANAVRYVGAQPIFVDCDPNTWTIDPDLVATALEDRARHGRVPKALLAVDLYGQCADYARLAEVCTRYDVPIVQDACEALGATYRGAPAGAQGALGVFSFNGNKIITTSGGGMLVSNRTAWIDKARKLASQAREPTPHYEHRELGFNYRMSNLLAAVGRAQLRSLGRRVERRRSIFDVYVQALSDVPGLQFMPEAEYGICTRWLTCATFHGYGAGIVNKLCIALAEHDIEARPLWKPMHLQPIYDGCKCYGGPVGETIFRTGICLPSGTSLSPEDQRRVVSIIRQALKSGGWL